MKKCVHCLRPLKKKTKDHVFPASWYPDDTPANTQRWTVPSCENCNNKLGGLEKDLFVRLGLCINPSNAEASGISKRALQTLGVGGLNLDEKERAHRKALLNKILKEVYPYNADVVPFPGMGFHPGYPKEMQIALRIPEKQLLEVSKKVLRGSEFKLTRRLIEYPYYLEVYFPNEDKIGDAIKVFEKLPVIKIGPGFQVSRGVSDNDSKISLYRIIIWGQFKIYGAIGTKQYFTDLDT